MSHQNRRQVRLPARLIDELALALEQALARLDTTDLPTRQVHDFGRRTLAELRRRLHADRDHKPGAGD